MRCGLIYISLPSTPYLIVSSFPIAGAIFLIRSIVTVRLAVALQHQREARVVTGKHARIGAAVAVRRHRPTREKV